MQQEYNKNKNIKNCQLYRYLGTYFTSFCRVSIVEFEQVNVSWDADYSHFVYLSSGFYKVLLSLYDALHDLVPFVQFKKRKKHPWRSVTFRTLLQGRFSRVIIVQMVSNRAVFHIVSKNTSKEKQGPLSFQYFLSRHFTKLLTVL